MSFCPKCGAQLPEGANACPQCGDMSANQQPAVQPEQPVAQPQQVATQPAYPEQNTPYGTY